MGDVLSGRYKIVSKVAEGGMATIFLASSIGADGTPRSVAIKAIKPELIDNADLVRQFMQEASVGTSLIHDNIVRVEDFGEHKGAYFMVLEYVAGKDLGGLIRALRKTRRCLSPRMVAHVAAGVCAALECAHRHIDEQGQFAPVIHRDISPANILLSYDGQVKLADFGIARVLGSVRMTQAGMLKGKYSYMSPEQSKGSEVDARSDLFSLGIVMWESLTARKLFKGKTAKDKLVKVRSATVPNLAEIASHVDAEMCRIVHKSLQLAPGDRFQTAQEMETFLRAFVGRTGDIDAGNLSALLADCFPEDDLSSIIADPIISAELEIAEEEEEVASTIVVEPPNFDEVSPNVGAHTVILFNVPAQTATPPPRAAHSDVGSRTPPYPGNQPLTPPPQRADVHHDGGVGVSHGGVTVKPIGGLTPPPRPLPSNPVEPQKTSEAGTLLGVPIPRGAPTQGQPPGQQPSEYAFTTPGQAQQTPATLILTPTPPPSPADTLPQPQLEPLPESPPPQQYLTSEPSQPESLTPAAPSPPQISTAQPGGSPTLATFPEGRALTPVSLPTFPEGVPAQPMSTYPELETNRPRDDKDQPTQRSERSRLLISFLIGVPTSLAIAIIVYILLMRFVIGPE